MVKYNLINNALDSLNEAVEYYKRGNHYQEQRAYKFCILLLGQSIELLVKQILVREHLFFIYEDIDKKRKASTYDKTVSYKTAVDRIEHICDVDISKIKNLLLELGQVRNKVQHSHCEYEIEYINTLLAKGFFIVNFIFTDVLKEDYSDYESVIYTDWFLELKSIADALKANRDMARKMISNEGVEKYYFELLPDEEIIIKCPVCGEKFLYTNNTEDFVKCAFCKKEFKDYEDMLGYDRDAIMYNDLISKLEKINVDFYECPECNSISVINDEPSDGYTCCSCYSFYEEVHCYSCSESYPNNSKYFSMGELYVDDGYHEVHVCDFCVEEQMFEEHRGH